MRKLGHCACIIGVALVAASAPAQTAPDPPSQPHLKYATVSGTRLGYVEAGRGTPVVFVHGALSDYRYWAPQVAAGARSFRVIAYSRRDFHPNKHDSDPALQTPDRDVTDLIELIGALGIAPVHLVGHSAGGHTALLTAVRRPDLVRSLVLEEGGFVVDHPSSRQALADIRPVVARAAEYRAAGEHEAAVRHFIDYVSGEGFFASASAEIRQMILDNEAVMGLRTNPSLTCRETASVEVPVLVVLGERSPPPIARLMSGVRECLRNEKTLTIAAASHGIHYEQPDAFNRAVFRFIAEH